MKGKKMLALILVLCLGLALGACGEKEVPSLFQTLPEGFSVERVTESSEVLYFGEEAVGTVVRYAVPEGTSLLTTSELAEFLKELGVIGENDEYMMGSALYGANFELSIVREEPLRHYFYYLYTPGTELYDVALEEERLTEENKDALLACVALPAA